MTLFNKSKMALVSTLALSLCFVSSAPVHAIEKTKHVQTYEIRIPHINTVDYRLRDVVQPPPPPPPAPVVHVAPKAPPRPPVVHAPVKHTHHSVAAPVVTGSGILAAIARCESGDRPGVVNSSGHAGLYQFDKGTWLANGGGKYAPTANLATPAEQTAIAEIVLSRRGTEPWIASKHCWG